MFELHEAQDILGWIWKIMNFVLSPCYVRPSWAEHRSAQCRAHGEGDFMDATCTRKWTNLSRHSQITGSRFGLACSSLFCRTFLAVAFKHFTMCSYLAQTAQRWPLCMLAWNEISRCPCNCGKMTSSRFIEDSLKYHFIRLHAVLSGRTDLNRPLEMWTLPLSETFGNSNV